MASKQIGREETIFLADGTEVTLRPLNIKKLKEFMKRFKDVNTLSERAAEGKVKDFESDFMDIVVDMAAICLSDDLKDATAYLYDKTADREVWEMKVNQEIVAFINEICGGIKFSGVDDGDFQKTEDEG